MTASKKHLVARLLLNRFTQRPMKKLQRFLNANIAESGFTRLQVQTKALSADLARTKAALQTSQKTTATLRRQMQEAKEQFKAAQQRIRDTQTRVLETQQRVKDTRARLEGMRQRAEHMQQRLLETQNRTRALQDNVKALKIKLSEARPAKTVLAEMLQGTSPEQALLRAVRDGTDPANRVIVRSFGFQLFSQPDTRPLGALLLGVFMFNDEMYAAAFGYLRAADEATVLDLAPREYFGSWMDCDAAAGRDALLAYFADRGQAMSTTRASQLVAVLIRHGFYADVKHLMRTVPALTAPPPETDPETAQKVAWVQARLDEGDSLPPQVSDDQINLAIMDYNLLDRDRTSSNRGDYVQTLASLANICRFQDVTFAGDTPLADLLTTLKGDVHPDRQLNAAPATVVPVALDRDYASGRPYHPDTWLICNGWFMHRNFRGVLDFPFPAEVNPIFLSFHVNDPDVLNADTVRELRKFEPIGCRDWTTVYRLRNYGVSCFFSGCLTTTIGQILPKAQNLPPHRLAAVEAHVDPAAYDGWEVDELSQIGDYVRDFSLVEGIMDSKQMLTSYLDYTKIQTSRLHCYLPCRSMGFEVDFTPRNRSDIRFEGLLDLNAADFGAIRQGIETKLEAMLGAIFAGQSKEDVMALWREICAPDVAAAEAYYNAEMASPPTVDIAPALQSITRQTLRPLSEGAVDLAFALDQNLADYLPATLQSVVDHTPGPINVHLITRGLDQTYLTTLAQAFPEVAFQLLDFSDVTYGDDLRLLSHTTEATLDRLYLPEILPDVPKVLYLDIDLLVRHDLRPLFETDLADHVLAGKFSSMTAWQNAIRLLTRASLKLPPQAAWEMRRRMHKRLVMPVRTFNAGVIVMNLAQMRTEAFTQTHLHLVTQCYCNDQDVLNIYAAGRVKEIDPSWNYVPAHDYDTDPRLIHWAGSSKPWDKEHYALWQSEFDATMQAAAARMTAATQGG